MFEDVDVQADCIRIHFENGQTVEVMRDGSVFKVNRYDDGRVLREPLTYRQS